MKALYSFPAVFHHAGDGISISFPDLPGCISCASDEKNAQMMACDALELMLFAMCRDKKRIPRPTPQEDISAGEDEIVHVIRANMTHARRLASISANRHQLFAHDKKNGLLTIPFTEDDLPKRMTEMIFDFTGIDPKLAEQQ